MRRLLVTVIFFVGCNTSLKITTTQPRNEAAAPNEATPDPEQQPPSVVADETQTNSGTTQTEPPAPANNPPPVPELVGDFGMLREYIQSRSPVAILLSKALIDSNESLELILANNSATLLDANTMTNLIASGALKQVSSTAYSLELPQSVADQLEMGENQLKLNILSHTTPRSMTAKVTKFDFDIFGVAITHFDTSVQVSSGFQGWVNVLAPATVHSTMSTMIVGFTNIVNQ